MLNIILNEKKVYNEFMETYELPHNVSLITMINIIVKKNYLDGLLKEDNYKDVMDILKLSLKEDFVYTKWNKSIKMRVDKFYKFARSHPQSMIDVKKITLSKSELDKIKNLDTKQQQKTMFILIVYAKIFNSINGGDYWVNQPIGKLFKEARVSLKSLEQKKLLNELYKKEYISLSSISSKTNIKVNIIEGYDEELVIDDFEGVVYNYLNYIGEKWKRCIECGEKWFKIKNNKMKTCKKCSEYTRLERQKKYQKN